MRLFLHFHFPERDPVIMRNHPTEIICNCSGTGGQTATGSVEAVVDLERADEVEVSPHRKRRGVVRSKRSVKNDAAGKCAQTLKGVEATEKDVGSEDAQEEDHREALKRKRTASDCTNPRNDAV
jgi:hypothetical protein